MNTETSFIPTLEEAARRVTRLGQFEFRLAVSRCGEDATLEEVVAAIKEHRKPFMDSLGCNIGSSIRLSADAWDKLARESDDAAKRELLKDSKALKGVDELLAKANAAAEAARKAHDEFDRNYAELDAIPTQIDKLDLKLSEINASRKHLANADETLKKLYAAALRGAFIENGALEVWSGVIATKSLRLEVLAEIEAETKAELSKLEARERELKKTLGIK